jgi:hypothetical protein
LTRSFSPQDPTWQEFLAGYHDASQPVAWTHSFYLAHAREYGESPFGCFSYDYESETRTVRLHFGDRDASGAGPLSEERQQVRRAELRVARPALPHRALLHILRPHLTRRRAALFACNSSGRS